MPYPIHLLNRPTRLDNPRVVRLAERAQERCAHFCAYNLSRKPVIQIRYSGSRYVAECCYFTDAGRFRFAVLFEED